MKEKQIIGKRKEEVKKKTPKISENYFYAKKYFI